MFFRINWWGLNKNFQEIKLFICHCSFITLAQKTTMRLQIVILLDTLRQALSWITTIIHYLPFKNFLSFAVCSVLLFFHNLCPKYSWIPLDFCVCVCFQLFVYGFIFSLKKWAYLKHERVLLYSKTDRLAGFSNPSLSFSFKLYLLQANLV